MLKYIFKGTGGGVGAVVAGAGEVSAGLFVGVEVDDEDVVFVAGVVDEVSAGVFPGVVLVVLSAALLLTGISSSGLLGEVSDLEV